MSAGRDLRNHLVYSLNPQRRENTAVIHTGHVFILLGTLAVQARPEKLP